MPSSRGSLAPVPDDASSRARLASWYAQGPSDGLGDRLLMFDNGATGPLELLRVRPDFALVPEFERRLRQRVERLGSFAHPAFAQVRAVNHLDNGEGLTVVSAHVPGTRLSELFRSARPQSGMHPASARWAMRELTVALAELHRQGRDIAHGSLAPDRIVITAERHLVITDYVFADALQGMNLPGERLWSELALVTAPAGGPLDQRSDVIQLALTVMGLVTGRRVSPAEYVQQLPELLDEFSAAAARRAPDLATSIRAWLEQALLPSGFDSAVDAELALLDTPGLPMPVAVAAAPAPATAAAPAPAAPPADLPSPHPPSPVELPQPADLRDRPPTHTAAAGEDLVPVRTSPRLRRAVAALAIVALVEAAVIAGLWSRAPERPAQSRINIETGSPGDAVFIRDRQVGVTPLDLQIEPGTTSVRVVGQPPLPATGAVLATSQAAPARVQAAATPAPPPAPRSGGVQIIAPIALQIVEGERVLGSSAAGPVFAAPGVHNLELVNNALGFRTRQTVRIVAGRVVPLRVEPPKGAISVNAQPWAQVLIDGKVVGDTPLANVPLALGEHEVVFRHPQLGERRQKATVQAGVQTRVSASFNP
jgi:hypothetical protein